MGLDPKVFIKDKTEMSRILIQNGVIVTMNASREVLHGDILIENNKIKKIGKNLKINERYHKIDASRAWVLPGFVQTHIHLCQTLFRNQAENLELLEWLRKKIWPLEGGHTKESLRLSAELGLSELLKGGTTTVLDMGTVHHTDVIFESCEQAGIRTFCGKAMMDAGDGIPPSLKEKTEKSLEETLKLIDRWHGKAQGRIQYALAPRFVLSCSEPLLKKIATIGEEKKLLIHTHAAENKKEVQAVKKEKGKSNIHYLNDLGLCGKRSCFAHCIWLEDEEFEILSKTQTTVSHSPSSNLKLGSGIARVPEMLARKINVTLGADGAPCNNNLDMFQEMKLAGLIQKPQTGELSCEKIFEMATLNGAKALGLDNKIGSLEEGKLADILIIDKETLHAVPSGESEKGYPYDALVYSTRASDVKTVIIDGKIVMKDRRLMTLSESDILKDVQRHCRR